MRKTAAESTRPSTVSITDEGVSVTREGAAATKFAWNDVVHCTNAVDVWIFALKGGKDAVLVPHRQFEPAERDQVNAFLSTWPKRRYRYSPWQ